MSVFPLSGKQHTHHQQDKGCVGKREKARERDDDDNPDDDDGG